MATRTRKKTSKASAARVAAAQERDAELQEMTEQALNDPAIGTKVTALLTTAAPRFMSYSLRNIALLMSQAAKRGMTLTDVDSYEGWLERGRQVRRGEKALYINRPITRARRDDKDQAAEDDDEKKARRPKFRAVRRFDLSQTDPIEDFEPADDTEGEDGGATPAQALMESLTKDAARIGYEIVIWPEQEYGAPISVDDEAGLIHVHEGDDEAAILARLTSIVAALIAEQTSEHEQDGDRPGREPRAERATRPADEVPTLTIL